MASSSSTASGLPLRLLALTAASAIRIDTVSDPSVKLYNGVEMPMVGAGTWQYDNDTAQASVEAALAIGYTHIDTAWNYNNQVGVGKALKGVDRNSYFLTTKIPGCSLPIQDPMDCYRDAKEYLSEDLRDLNVDYLDLVLVHFPPRSGGCGEPNCAAMQNQWKAVEELYASNLTRAIGVSNFCQSCFECLKKTQKVLPMVNQIQYHVGMGPNPQELFSYMKELNIMPQAYSPLGNGSPELINGKLTTSIGQKYNKSSVQIALKYVVQHGVPVLTKSTSEQYLKEDIDLFDFDLSEEDMAKLDAAKKPSGTPSFACTS